MVYYLKGMKNKTGCTSPSPEMFHTIKYGLMFLIKGFQLQVQTDFPHQTVIVCRVYLPPKIHILPDPKDITNFSDASGHTNRSLMPGMSSMGFQTNNHGQFWEMGLSATYERRQFYWRTSVHSIRSSMNIFVVTALGVATWMLIRNKCSLLIH